MAYEQKQSKKRLPTLNANRVTIRFWKRDTSRKPKKSGHLTIQTYSGGTNGRGHYMYLSIHASTSVRIIYFRKNYTYERDCRHMGCMPTGIIDLYSLNVESINQAYETFINSGRLNFDNIYIWRKILAAGGLENLVNPFPKGEKIVAEITNVISFLTFSLTENILNINNFEAVVDTWNICKRARDVERERYEYYDKGGRLTLKTRIINEAKNLDAKDTQGNTVLHVAAKGKHYKLYARLRYLGANQEIKDNGGKYPAYYLSRLERKKIDDLYNIFSVIIDDFERPVEDTILSAISVRQSNLDNVATRRTLVNLNNDPHIAPLLELVKMGILGRHRRSERDCVINDNYDSDDENEEKLNLSKQCLSITIDPHSATVECLISDGKCAHGITTFDNKICLGGHRTLNEIRGTFIHECTHFVAMETFQNSARPYAKDDTTNKRQFTQIADNLYRVRRRLDPIVRGAFSQGYRRRRQVHDELIVRIIQMKVHYPDGLRRIQRVPELRALWHYYTNIFLPAVRRHITWLEDKMLSGWPIGMFRGAGNPNFRFERRDSLGSTHSIPLQPYTLAELINLFGKQWVQSQQREASIDDALRERHLRRGQAIKQNNNCLLDVIYQHLENQFGETLTQRLSKTQFFLIIKRRLRKPLDAGLSINDPTEGTAILKHCIQLIYERIDTLVAFSLNVFIADSHGNLGAVSDIRLIEEQVARIIATCYPRALEPTNIVLNMIYVNYNHYEPLFMVLEY